MNSLTPLKGLKFTESDGLATRTLCPVMNISTEADKLLAKQSQNHQDNNRNYS